MTIKVNETDPRMLEEKETSMLRTPTTARPAISAVLAIAGLILLAACDGGGGGGGSPSPTPTTAPTAPTPTLGYDIKTLQFIWPAVSGATFYRLYENPNGVSGYTQVGADITGTSVDHSIALYQRINATYIVSACNSAGCTDSAPIALAANLIPAIGYAKASNTGASDNFGYAVALSADGATLAVGAPYESSAASGIDGNQVDDCGAATPTNCAAYSGAVYVFTRNGSTWSQQAYVKASNTGANDYFGIALALSADGNTLAVGALYESSAATGISGNQVDDCGAATPINCADVSGAAYVFTRSGTTWTQQAYVKASNTGTGDNFGTSLALSTDGNTLAVGAPYEFRAAGAAYVFTRNGTTWTQQAYVKASKTEPWLGDGHSFGYALDALPISPMPMATRSRSGLPARTAPPPASVAIRMIAVVWRRQSTVPSTPARPMFSRAAGLPGPSRPM